MFGVARCASLLASRTKFLSSTVRFLRRIRLLPLMRRGLAAITRPQLDLQLRFGRYCT
ncbi:hypothetical protein LINGRAHAP2_LOCUS11324 [Linum grandiflorum]